MDHSVRSLLEVCEIYPILTETAKFIGEQLPNLFANSWDIPNSEATVVQIPVPLLRWTHNNIEQFLNFKHDENGKALPAEDRRSMLCFVVQNPLQTFLHVRWCSLTASSGA